MNRCILRLWRFPVFLLLLFSVVLADSKLKPLPRFLRSKRLADRYLSTRDVDDILKFERVEPVCDQLLKRENVDAKYRLEALENLANIKGGDPVDELLTRVDDTKLSESVFADLVELLPRLSTEHLKKHEQRLQQASETGENAIYRQAAIIARIIADRSIDTVWAAGNGNENFRIDTLAGLRLLSDMEQMEKIKPRLTTLLNNEASPPVQMAAIDAVQYLPGDRQEFFSRIAELIQNGQHVDSGIAALMKLGQDNIVATQVEPLVRHIFGYLESMPIKQRAEVTGQNCVELLRLLSHALSNSRQLQVQAKLNRLSVLAIHVTALPEQMAYDKTVLLIDARRPVRITFLNDDIMPHNLVIGSAPKARVELGLMSDEMQNDKDALAKGYLPESEMVLFASKMIQPGQQSIVDFVMPEPGVYPFVCTFPGHWSKMYGALKVVEDSRAFVAANSTMPSADDLLGIKKVEWKFEDLAAEIADVESDRSFASGKRWFKQGSCYSCHRMRGEGGLIGPDLTEISTKYKTAKDVLTHIMQPSKAIDDKFSALRVIDADGMIHQGIVLKRTDEELFLQTNPLATDCTPTIIRLDAIEEESKSTISAMPENLLNAIVDKSEIYDLIAYLMSGGVESDKRFAK